jgi:hypothetical protein
VNSVEERDQVRGTTRRIDRNLSVLLPVDQVDESEQKGASFHAP